MTQSAKPQSLTNDRLITKWSPCSETPLISTLTSSKSTTKRQSLRKHIQTNHCRKNPSELREFASVQCETKGKKSPKQHRSVPTHTNAHTRLTRSQEDDEEQKRRPHHDSFRHHHHHHKTLLLAQAPTDPNGYG